MKIGIANFYDQSRMINYEASDYEKYADELKHLRDQLGEMETLKQSVTELEKRVREHLRGETGGKGTKSKKKHHHLGGAFVVDDNGLEPLTLRTSSECSTS